MSKQMYVLIKFLRR